MEEQISKIKEVIDKLRPFLINDGGNIEFIKYENNIVYVRLGGACANCSIMDITLKDGIEAAIQEEVPEVLEVINLDSEDSIDL
jgi:Fe-S cluster biogenesis protein NfuA